MAIAHLSKMRRDIFFFQLDCQQVFKTFRNNKQIGIEYHSSQLNNVLELIVSYW